MAMTSTLTVLGSCGAWPEPGRACSGFVLDHDGFRVVVDLGYGTLPRLLAHRDDPFADGVDAVVITHRHPDHCVDLHGLFRARAMGDGDKTAVPVYAAEGVRDVMAGLEEEHDRADIDEVFDWHPLPGGPYDLGPFRLLSRALPHYVPNAGIRLEARDLTVAYTGDSGPDPALVELAAGADLFVAESTEAAKSSGPSADQYLAADEAARAAQAAGARRLLLTHFWPGMDRAEAGRVARDHFTGEVLLADEGLVVPLR